MEAEENRAQAQSTSGSAGSTEHLVCMDCGSTYGRYWSTSDGTAILCPTCATMNGLGCP